MEPTGVFVSRPALSSYSKEILTHLFFVENYRTPVFDSPQTKLQPVCIRILLEYIREV